MTRPIHTRPTELILWSGDLSLPAVVTLPDRPPTAGIVTLHPAMGPEHDYFLFRHLGRLLTPRGIAVLSYDRRPAAGDDDVPFALQADDALAAADVLAERLGPRITIGLWAFSQGAWAAPVAAARSDRIAFLVLIGASGVSPAAQMRYSAGEALRRAGHGDAEIARAVEARLAIESCLRGEATHADAQRAVDSIATEPWFDRLYLPRTLPADATWTDMDFDPLPAMRGVRCPVLLIYGDDEAVPAEASIAAWRDAAAATGAPLEVVRLPRSTHLPTIGGEPSIESVDPAYETTMLGWLDRLLAPD